MALLLNDGDTQTPPTQYVKIISYEEEYHARNYLRGAKGKASGL